MATRERGAGRYDRCPRCCAATAVWPSFTTLLPRSVTCVYECQECGHSWWTTYYAPACGVARGGEPVRIGDAL